jgi:tetratricopeptide (TPR) repeat protein
VLAVLLASWVLAAAALAGADDATAVEALAAGDEWYARRAEGGQGGMALPGPADAAIAAYRRAIGLDPQSQSARCRLMRALFFRANFCPASAEERRLLLEEARAAGDRAVSALEAAAGGARGAKRIETLRAMPGAAEVYFWTAVSWGEWALQRGKLAAARQGAGPKIRDLAQTVIDLDPDLEQGGGYRILGRLHAESPKIPFITGWVSRREALANLHRSLEHGPENTVSQLFLAEAILDHEPARNEEARQLLRKCASAVPRPEYLIEDAYYIEQARKTLARIR